jgi:phospholipid transport system substrate-binding protein
MGKLTMVIALLFALGTVPAHVSGQDSPDAVVRGRNEAVKAALDAAGDPISDEVRDELKDVINGLIDFRELSRRALRRYWSARTPEEQNQFVDVFRALVRNSSVKKLEVYEVDSTTYQPPETDGDRSRVVTVAHEGSKEVEIVYLMHRVDGEWKAYDVIIDGSSTLRTYQDSFQREIKATSYEEMYDRLVERLEQDEGSTG